MGRTLLKVHDFILIEPSPDPRALQPLTPVDDAENIEQYENELRRAILTNSVENVALTGPYGSGKSSIIRTFFRHNPQLSALYVSLADFKDEPSGQPPKGATRSNQDEGINERIEFSILQQLFYRVKESHIPFSRFKRIRPVSVMRVSLFATITLFFFLSVIYCVYEGWAPVIDFLNVLKTNSFDAPAFEPLSINGLSVIFLSIGAYVIVYYLVRLFRVGLIKLTLQGTEIELSKDKELSVLNEHLDEILYFFSSTRFTILVLEDIDRFRNTEIFVKLREINRLLNSSMQIGRKITFIYALRDDVFQNEERTKFFDLIIPVVPYINAANAADELIKTFKDLRLEDPIPHSFHNTLADYLTDQRLIVNIINEFKIYSQQLSGTKLDSQRMLAMIVYKNLYPADFSLLQENKGIVFDLFKMKEPEIVTLQQKITAVIAEINQKLHQLAVQTHDSITSLRLTYIAAFFQLIFQKSNRNYPTGRVYLSGTAYDLMGLAKDEAFNNLRRHPQFQVDTSSGLIWYELHFSEVEKLVGGKPYEDRLKALEATLSYDRNKLTAELARNRVELQRISGYTFTEILQYKKLSEFKSTVTEKPCLAFLISGGFIREHDYKDYLSYFTPSQLSLSDREFISAVRIEKALPYSHALQYVSRVAESLTITEFSSSGAMNFRLVQYFLENPNEYADKRDVLLDFISSNLTITFAFINGMRFSQVAFQLLLAEVVARNSRFWLFMIRESNATPDTISNFLNELLLAAEEKDIKALDVDRVLSNSISDDPSMLCFKTIPPLSKIIRTFFDLDVRFKVPPDGAQVNAVIADYVYEHHLYEINPEMINFFIGYKNVTDNLSEFNQAQLSNIQNTLALSMMAEYLQRNIEQYIDAVYLKIKDHTLERQEVVLSLLNNEKISNRAKEAIIQCTPLIIQTLRESPSAYWSSLFRNRRIRPLWMNVFPYYYSDGLDDVLLNWLHLGENLHALADDKIPEQAEGEPSEIKEYRGMIEDLIEDSDLSDLIKLALVPAIAFTVRDVNLSGASSELIEALIRKLAFTPKTANSLKRGHPEFFHDFIIREWEAFTKEYDHLEMSQEDVQSLLTANLNREQRLFIYEKQNVGRLLDFISQGIDLPLEIAASSALNLEERVLQNLPDGISQSNTALLISANIDVVDLPLIIKLLDSAGGDFKKIASKAGKEIRRTDATELLLESLRNKQILIESFQTKKVTIEVNYLPS